MLTTNDKYPVQDYESLPSLIQMQLSEKQKNFSDSVFPFLEPTLNFKYFKTRNDRHSYFISEITDCGRLS